MLTRDVRFEGFAADDWLRFVQLWQPQATSPLEPGHPRGGLVIVHDDGAVITMIHTRGGRIEAPFGAQAPDQVEARALALRSRQPSILADLAREHGARWALAMRVGALDEVMERFGAGVRRGDDLTAQSLLLASIVRELIAEGLVAIWPRHLANIPLPSPRLVHRTLDALCPDGRAIALGVFSAGDLWTACVARRRGHAFDLILGPENLRPALGLLSGDWRRDYRHLEHAIEQNCAPLGLGCFADLATFRALQAEGHPGAWSRAVAVRDVIITPMPSAVGLALGVDALRYALKGVLGAILKR
ncbi:MAG: hypothetical protein ACREJ3_17815 [Polyangiaceae bacterium]